MKTVCFALLGVVAVLVLVVLSPLVLVYFLFDRFCCLLEELAPHQNRKDKNGGGRLGLLKKLFSAFPLNAKNIPKVERLLPYQRPF